MYIINSNLVSVIQSVKDKCKLYYDNYDIYMYYDKLKKVKLVINILNINIINFIFDYFIFPEKN
jgi:hypothetical protein